MSLSRKGSRKIVIDGVTYRWRLRRRPTYFQALAWTPCTFAVEYADSLGAALVVTTHQPHPSNWVGREATPVLPSDVARAVQLALREGWAPETPGAPFHLDRAEGPARTSAWPRPRR